MAVQMFLTHHCTRYKHTNTSRHTAGTARYWALGGWVHPRAGLHDVEKRNLLILPGLELRPRGRPARNQSQELPITEPKVHYRIHKSQ
jgi:hypothetical protein